MRRTFLYLALATAACFLVDSAVGQERLRLAEGNYRVWSDQHGRQAKASWSGSVFADETIVLHDAAGKAHRISIKRLSIKDQEHIHQQRRTLTSAQVESQLDAYKANLPDNAAAYEAQLHDLRQLVDEHITNRKWHAAIQASYVANFVSRLP